MARLCDNWYWVVLMMVLCGAGGFVTGFYSAGRAATTRLALTPTPDLSLPARGEAAPRLPPQLAAKILDELRSPDFLKPTAASAAPAMNPEELDANLTVVLEPENGILTITLRGRLPWTVVRQANHFGSQALERVRSLWEKDLAEQRHSLDLQAAAVEAGLLRIRAELTALRKSNDVFDITREFAEAMDKRAALESRLASLRGQLEGNAAKSRLLAEENQQQNPALVATREALYQALARYTEEHPKVKALRAALAQMETGGSNAPTPPGLVYPAGGNPLAASLQTQMIELRAQTAALQKELETLTTNRETLLTRLQELSRKDPEFARLQSQSQALQESRDALLRQQNGFMLRAIQGTPGLRVLQPARTANLTWRGNTMDGCLWGAAAGLGGALVALLLVLSNGPSRRIRSRQELEAATGLPVLACLDDLQNMDRKAREMWAFQTLSLLKANLRQTGDRALICGFVSSAPQEGKSTLIKLLAEAASRQGYCVVTASHKNRGLRPAANANQEPNQAGVPPASAGQSVIPVVPAESLSGQLLAETPHLPVRIGMADWMWSWQHRAQFEQALNNWSMIENLAVFVELPPYSTPAGVMMAEKVPNLLWVSGQDVAHAGRTRLQVDTLRRAHDGLIGAALNRPKRRRGRRWRAAAALFGGVLAGLLAGPAPGWAQSNAPSPAPPAPVAVAKAAPVLSVSSPDQMADWQRRLTLGPSDVLDISLYGQADSARAGLVIGPDGRLNYLQARDVLASGLTVDELRAELEKVLSKYHLTPQVVINPASYHSKRYYLLGNVTQRGVYLLDRPTTIIEAIARARGFISAVNQQNVSLMVDLGRSFLVRRGATGDYAKFPVDFEGLFLRGDLSQNAGLAPDDYLFFPALLTQEIYVLGEVRGPGVLPLGKELTVLGAIAARGGFTEKAWKTRALVVRGSLAKPQLFVVNCEDVLHARGTDLKLVNRDIVYVHSKPWARAEDLVERAAITFANSVVMGFVNQNIVNQSR
jgi:polysaccharide biosynthesis/export protein